MQKSSSPALNQLLRVVRSCKATFWEFEAAPATARAASCDWTRHQQAPGPWFPPPGPRLFSALPALAPSTEEDWWNRPEDTARQVPGEAHYQLWAQLANIRDQGTLRQAERRTRGKPNTAYPFAPVTAYLNSRKRNGEFDDTVLDLWARQVQQEMKVAQDAYNAYMEDAKKKGLKGMGSGLSSMRKFLKEWHPQLLKAIETEQAEVSWANIASPSP